MIEQNRIIDALKQANSELAQRFVQEVSLLKQHPSVLVALSGGVDSSLVALASLLALGPKALAITFDTVVIHPQEIEDARAVAEEIGIRHEVIKLDLLKEHKVVNNDENRCYFCKTYLIDELETYKKTHSLGTIIEGSNLSDLNDYRPGIRALKEKGILSPHIEAGLTKSMVREIAKIVGLSVADKPSASCLATRIPYGEPLETTRLNRIGQAESLVAKFIPQGHIRVRDHGDIARIELSPESFSFVNQEKIRKAMISSLRELGYKHITLDLQGYVDMATEGSKG